MGEQGRARPELRTTARSEELSVDWLAAERLDRALLSSWERLVERDPFGTVFQTPAWVMTWQRHFGRGRLHLLTVRRNSRLLALLPLCESRLRVRGVNVCVLYFAGEPQADLLGALCRPDAPEGLQVLVDELLARVDDVDLLRLSEIAADSPLQRALHKAAAERGVPAASEVCARAPVLFLDRPLAAIENGYSKSLRTRLKRARRAQQRAGTIDFRRWRPSPAELSQLLERLRQLENRTWKGTRDVGIFSSRPKFEFISEISHEFAERGWLDVATLSLNDRLIAYRYGFRHRGRFLDYNLAHDPEFDRLSPGRVLLDEIIRDSHRLGLDAVDASRGHKAPLHLLADWTSVERQHYRWRFFGRSLRGRCLSILERQVRPVWHQVRRLARRDFGPLSFGGLGRSFT